MSVPTRGETYVKLMHHMREAQDCSAMLAHLHNTESNDHDKVLARGWLAVEELLKGMIHKLTQLAQGRLN